MLESSSAQARAVACACLGDLAQAHPPLQLHLSQVPSCMLPMCTLLAARVYVTAVSMPAVHDLVEGSGVCL